MKIHIDPIENLREQANDLANQYFNRLAINSAHHDSLIHSRIATKDFDGQHPVEQRERDRQVMLGLIAAAPTSEAVKKIIGDIANASSSKPKMAR